MSEYLVIGPNSRPLNTIWFILEVFKEDGVTRLKAQVPSTFQVTINEYDLFRRSGFCLAQATFSHYSGLAGFRQLAGIFL